MSSERVGIVLCHEVWGVTPALRAQAAAHQREGYLCTVLDLYGGVHTTGYKKASALRDALSLPEISAAVGSSVDVLRRQGADRVAVVGYSMGGAIALWSATALRIDLAVTYYGGGIAQPYWPDMPPGVELAGRLMVPWLGFYGGRDRLTPVRDLQALTTAAAQAPVPGEVMVFDRADHGFALDRNDPRHDVAAAMSAAERVGRALRPAGPLRS